MSKLLFGSQPSGQNKSQKPGKSPLFTNRLGIVLLFLGFNYTLMGTIIYPALPGIQERYNLTAAQLSLMASLPALLSMSLQPVVGRISDQINRKLVIGLGLCAYFLGASLAGVFLTFITASYIWVLFGRMVSGLGELGAFPHYLAVIHEKLPAENRQRMLGIMETLTSLGSVLAPVIGGALAAISLGFPFFACAVFALLALCLALWGVPNLNPARSSREEKPLSRRFEFHFSYLGGSLIMGTLVSINTFLGSYSYQFFGFNSQAIGFMLAASPLAMAAGASLAGKHGEFGYIPTRNLALGGLLGVTGLVLIGYALSPWVTVVGLILNGSVLGYWLTVFDHDAMNAGDPHSRGLRLSFFQQAKALGILLFPFILGNVIDITGSIRLIYILLAVALFSIGIVLLKLRSASELKPVDAYKS